MAVPANRNTPFFANFPIAEYDNKKATNIFVRLAFSQRIIDNIDYFDLYDIEDGDTPDMLSYRIYNDTGLGWIIMLANKIVDPQFDWYMTDKQFDDWIKSKYGSIEYAQTHTHHFEKVVVRNNITTGKTEEDRFVVNNDRLTQNRLLEPHEYYTPWNLYDLTADTIKREADDSTFVSDVNSFDYAALERTQAVFVYDINGQTIHEQAHGEEISIYDYEKRINENRRTIRIPHLTYVTQILNELSKLGQTNRPTEYSYIRRFG